MLGRAVAGSALIYGGIWLFQSRIAGQKEEIKEKITAAIESVNGE